ncbi:hypothetical protein [Marinactinospora rubrisoli]|uniref:Transposase n=1 Tax=Marinactinospora rubrisoli TaxID=2715399 RepID=A0ABW2KLQ4_9ACTN
MRRELDTLLTALWVFRDFEAITEQFGCHLVGPDREAGKPRHGRLARCRQWIEALIGM